MNTNSSNNLTQSKIPINCMKETLLPYKLIYSSPCDSCRKNRIKCDRDPKECAHCKRKGVKCTYLYTRKKRGPKGKLHHLMQQFETTLKTKDEEPLAQIQIQHNTTTTTTTRDTTSISNLLNPEPYYHHQSNQYTQKAMYDNQLLYNHSYLSDNIESSHPRQMPSSSVPYFESERRLNTFYLPSSSSSLSHDLINYSTSHNSRLSSPPSSRINSSNQIEQTNDNNELHFIIPRKNSTLNNYSNSLYSEFN